MKETGDNSVERLRAVLGIALLLLLVVWGGYDFFVTNDGIGYFLNTPRRIFYVIALSLVGGLGAMIFSRQSTQIRRTLAVVALTASAAALSGFLTFIVFCTISMWSILREDEKSLWMVGGFCV